MLQGRDAQPPQRDRALRRRRHRHRRRDPRRARHGPRRAADREHRRVLRRAARPRRASELPKGALHPRRILRGVVAGVRDYGNRMGIPTVNGGVWFDAGYVGNPLVFCGTVGLLPRRRRRRRRSRPGDRIVVVGGRTGRDGIHGATFSSAELHEQSRDASRARGADRRRDHREARADALLARARPRALPRDHRLRRGRPLVGRRRDGRAAAARDVELERVPLKYQGLVAGRDLDQRGAGAHGPRRAARAAGRARARSSPPRTSRRRSSAASRTPAGSCSATRGDAVGDLDMGFLHDGMPRPLRQATWRDRAGRPARPGLPARARPPRRCCGAARRRPTSPARSGSSASTTTRCRARSVVKPLVGVRHDGPADAAVLQPLPGSRRGRRARPAERTRATALLDPVRDGRGAPSTRRCATSSPSAAIPTRTAILDNFSWGNCERARAARGARARRRAAAATRALAYGTPFISGKDSLNNEFRVGERTIVDPADAADLGAGDRARRAPRGDDGPEGRRQPLLPRRRDARRARRLGLPRHLGFRGERGAGRVPRPDLARAPAILRRAARGDRARASCARCHDLSEGGLAVAAAEMAFAGELGPRLDLARVPCERLPAGFDGAATRLYSESCTRFLVEVAPERAAAFERALRRAPLRAPSARWPRRRAWPWPMRRPRAAARRRRSTSCARPTCGGFQADVTAQ